ncbi:nucleoside deaminase [Carnobacterium maltaromaticum]|uniref:nucleoside deaminase n=1 Tax=Carnobacterium maltaromaticum TaxID=2751 RepID=UPI003520F66E
MTRESHEFYLKRCIELSQSARDNGNTPFGALLVDAKGSILLEQENIEITEHICTGHAETSYTTAEPCAMCTGAIYWGNIGTIVFAMTEKRLLELTGDNDQNPTFNLPSSEIIARGQKDIQIIGPFPSVEVEAAAVHEGYWD